MTNRNRDVNSDLSNESTEKRIDQSMVLKLEEVGISVQELKQPQITPAY